MLHPHRVFTTHQLADLAFDSDATARHRLRVLRDLDVARPLPSPTRSGSAPWHYVLGRLGASVVAVERGHDPDDPYWRGAKSLAVAPSPRLSHLVEELRAPTIAVGSRPPAGPPWGTRAV